MIIFCSFLLTLVHSENLNAHRHVRYATYGIYWVVTCIIINAILLIDMMVHIIFYGCKTICFTKREVIWEAVIQVIFICMIWKYFGNLEDLGLQHNLIEML